MASHGGSSGAGSKSLPISKGLANMSFMKRAQAKAQAQQQRQPVSRQAAHDAIQAPSSSTAAEGLKTSPTAQISPQVANLRFMQRQAVKRKYDEALEEEEKKEQEVCRRN